MERISKLKNYIFPNIMSICGYIYAVKLYHINKIRDTIYSFPGADTTSEGIMYTFDRASLLVSFVIISFLLAVCSLTEYCIRKKLSLYTLRHKIPLAFEIIHSVIFWVGIWFPLSRLIFAIVVVISIPFVELFYT